jgi:hypothetical protein
LERVPLRDEPLRAEGRLRDDEPLRDDAPLRADVRRDDPLREEAVPRPAALRAEPLRGADRLREVEPLREALLREVALRLRVVRRRVVRRPPLRSDAGISALATACASRGISFSRNAAMRFSSRRIAFASCSVSRSPTIFARV